MDEFPESLEMSPETEVPDSAGAVHTPGAPSPEHIQPVFRGEGVRLRGRLRAYPKTGIDVIIRCNHSTHHSNDWSTDSKGKSKAPSDHLAAAVRSLG